MDTDQPTPTYSIKTVAGTFEVDFAALSPEKSQYLAMMSCSPAWGASWPGLNLYADDAEFKRQFEAVYGPLTAK